MKAAGDRPIVLVSNRGPFAWTASDDGELSARRAAGGFAATTAALLDGSGTTWIAAAMTDGDRMAAQRGAADVEGFHLRLLSPDPDDYRAFYDVVSNSILWFLHHGLFDLSRRPTFDHHFRQAWDRYRAVSATFADAVSEEAPDGAAVLVQDYHLSLLGRMIAERRPDLDAVHFSHTPFCGPTSIRVLPDDVAGELVEGMGGFAACGFHCDRWANTFAASCREVGREPPPTFVAPIGPHPDDIGAAAASKACHEAHAALEVELGGRKLLLRVDRIELSKNIVRGFLAYDELLRRHPEWCEQVTFGAFLYPSREGLPEYLAYRNEVESLAARLNDEWGTPDWTPVILDADDDFPRSVAALRRYDVLLVNPIRDGLNLVAKEGPLVNERDGVVALSREAGAWQEMAGAALEVNPYDVAGTADILHRALTMTPGERTAHAAALRKAALARSPTDWLTDQLAAL